MPPLHEPREHNDALAPQKRNRLGGCQNVSVELSQDLGPLDGIEGGALLLVKSVDFAVLVPGVAERRRLFAQELDKILCRIVEVVRDEFHADFEVSRR